jgi:hypothetical protein
LLENSLFLPFKLNWDEALDNYRHKNHGKEIWKLQFPKLLAENWMTTAAPRVAATGFISTGIYPFNPVVLPETTFEPSSVSASDTTQRQPEPKYTTKSWQLRNFHKS